ncbi:type II toxin-antitoxin system VapC family toxin [Candidatus Sulfurimonas marisnigri]|uniref:Type II toxin-antitoxin system VapC family toxin n=1 Tax=Candidatus Sulfurimonas marisnigri TaxID=2740405 RepID=A0A7S7LYY5_9BACT|nr:PIN domain-containing protein [Candidatus Sulfurimonas marisnigri]QOY54053.1 type II toxin-antitoxin system VapC family toxin [Candidatus Sulfurimonas marisnigri]
MYKKVFIDANIFIDINDRNRKRYQESLDILKYLTQNGIGIYTSCDLITTIYYILAKEDKANALSGIERINKICKVIEFSNKEISLACQLMNKDKNYKDLEDTLQYILAKKSECELIISNDKNFYSSEVELLNTEEFCAKYI